MVIPAASPAAVPPVVRRADALRAAVAAAAGAADVAGAALFPGVAVFAGAAFRTGAAFLVDAAFLAGAAFLPAAPDGVPDAAVPAGVDPRGAALGAASAAGVRAREAVALPVRVGLLTGMVWPFRCGVALAPSSADRWRG
jgi:hypothetical protein